MELFYFSWIIWPLVLIAAVVFIARHVSAGRRKGAGGAVDPKNQYLQVAVSKEDGMSQSFLVFSVLFLGLTLAAINKDLSDPFGWRTVICVVGLASFLISYWQRAVSLLVIGIVALVSWWGSVLYLWSFSGKNIAGSGMFVGLTFVMLLMFAVGRLHEAMGKKRFGVVYTGLGLLCSTGILFWLSTQWGLYSIQAMSMGSPVMASWQLATSILVLVVAILGALFGGLGKKALSASEVLGVIIMMCLFGAVVFNGGQPLFANGSSGLFSGSGRLTDSGVLWAIIYNLAIFGELVALIVAGYSRRETWLINLGSVLMFILIFVKYFDWFFDSVDKSVLFIGAGIILVLAGWFMEKGRRRMITQIKSHV